jgi:hypothetical protein
LIDARRQPQAELPRCLERVDHVQIVGPGLGPVFPRVAGGISTHIVVRPVRWWPRGIVLLQRRVIIVALICFGRTGSQASAARSGRGIGVGRRGDTCRAQAMSPPVFVVDTNAVVAGLVTGSSRSPVALVLDAMLSGTLVFLLSPALLDEYRSVLSRPKLVKLHGLTEAQMDQLLVELTANAI